MVLVQFGDQVELLIDQICLYVFDIEMELVIDWGIFSGMCGQMDIQGFGYEYFGQG